MSLQIIKWLDFIDSSISQESSQESQKCAITIGVFDGVHLGHQALIECIVKRGPNPTVITFRDNPRKIFPDSYDGDLYSLKQKLAIFESLGVEQVVLIDFSSEFCKLKGEEFIEILQKTGKMGFLAIGSNFRCGFQQNTGANLIKEMNINKGIPTELILPVLESMEMGSRPVSSSCIRSAIIKGDMKLAAMLLGRNFNLDLSDITPLYKKSGYGWRERKVFIYDLRQVNRIIPAKGQYNVMIYPDGIKSCLDTDDGMVFIPQKAMSLEFMNCQ